MATAEQLTPNLHYIVYFQDRIMRGLEYWRDHPAIRELKVAILDGERETILTVIGLGLEFPPAWLLVKQLIVALTPYMERRGHWDGWHGVLQKAIAAAQRADDVGSEITLTALLARLSQRMSRPADVVTYYCRTMRLARQTGNRFEEARACSNLGFHYIARGRWWRAEVLNCKALVLFDELASRHGQAHTHNHLGLLYTRQRRWSEAETHLKSACTLWEKIGDQHSIIYGYENLSVLYIDMGQPTEALPWLEKAYHQVNLTGEKAELGGILSNMGMAWRDKGDWIQAESYLRQAEAIFQQYGNHHGLAQVWGHIGILYLRQAKESETRIFLQNARQLFHRLQDVDHEMKALTYLIECELLSKRPADAEIYLTEAETLLAQHDLNQQGEFFVTQIRQFRQRLTTLL